MTTTKVYRADQVTVSLAGIPIRGYGDGEFVRIEMEADDYGDVVGTDGEVTRFKTQDPRATITLILMASSDANDQLSDLADADANSPSGAGIGVFQCRDNNGRSLHRAGACWIARRPNAAFGREVGTREWKLRAVMDKHYAGGNIAIG
jgi:hypothetical protein